MHTAALAFVASLTLTLAATAQESTWITSFEDAKAAAKKEQKVILANFTGSDWCGWCIKLKDEVFSKPEFQAWAEKKVVLLELDFPRKKEISADLKEQNAGLAKQFGIRGYPTIVMMDADGKQLGQLGYKKGGPKAWIEAAEAQMAPKADGDEWLTDYKQALEKAKKEKKVVLADFTGSDWCGWCIKLKDEVFSKPEFQEWAKEHVVLLELDFPRNKPLSAELKAQNEKLRDEFGIEGYPTILFLDAKGKKVGQTGYVAGGPEKWIEAAEKELGLKSTKKKGKDKDKKDKDNG
ncbi:MAG: thioredoxin family protein [Planctomycetes bacterium]|nr:thioredoxin family protein [Planctomycetota bacterium]